MHDLLYVHFFISPFPCGILLSIHSICTFLCCRMSPTSIGLKAACELYLRYTTRTRELESADFDLVKSQLIEVRRARVSPATHLRQGGLESLVKYTRGDCWNAQDMAGRHRQGRHHSHICLQLSGLITTSTRAICADILTLLSDACSCSVATSLVRPPQEREPPLHSWAHALCATRPVWIATI